MQGPQRPQVSSAQGESAQSDHPVPRRAAEGPWRRRLASQLLQVSAPAAPLGPSQMPGAVCVGRTGSRKPRGEAVGSYGC